VKNLSPFKALDNQSYPAKNIGQLLKAQHVHVRQIETYKVRPPSYLCCFMTRMNTIVRYIPSTIEFAQVMSVNISLS